MLAHMNPAQTAARPSPTPSQPGNTNKVTKSQKSKMPPGYKFGGFPTETLDPIIKQALFNAITKRENQCRAYPAPPAADIVSLVRVSLDLALTSPPANDIVTKHLENLIKAQDDVLKTDEALTYRHLHDHTHPDHQRGRAARAYKGHAVHRYCSMCKMWVDAQKLSELIVWDLMAAKRAVERVKDRGFYTMGKHGWMDRRA